MYLLNVLFFLGAVFIDYKERIDSNRSKVCHQKAAGSAWKFLIQPLEMVSSWSFKSNKNRRNAVIGSPIRAFRLFFILE